MSAPETDFSELDTNALFPGHQITDAARCLSALLNMSSASPAEIMEKYPLLVVGLALIAQIEAQSSALQDIAEGVDMISAFGIPAPESAADVQAEPEVTFLLKGLQPQQMYDALKAGFQRLHPDCSAEQHAAAMAYFAKLVGL